MKLRVAICIERKLSALPATLTRHIVAPVVICGEVKDVDVNENALPRNIIESLGKKGYVIVDDVELSKKLFGIELSTNSYLKVYLL